MPPLSPLARRELWRVCTCVATGAQKTGPVPRLTAPKPNSQAADQAGTVRRGVTCGKQRPETGPKPDQSQSGVHLPDCGLGGWVPEAVFCTLSGQQRGTPLSIAERYISRLPWPDAPTIAATTRLMVAAAYRQKANGPKIIDSYEKPTPPSLKSMPACAHLRVVNGTD